MLKHKNFALITYAFILHFKRNNNFCFFNEIIYINNANLNYFLILKKFYFFKFFTFKKIKKIVTYEYIDNIKNKIVAFKKSEVLIWNKEIKSRVKNLTKIKYNLFKFWKYSFIKKSYFIKSNFFFKFLKKRILCAQLFAVNFFCNLKKQKQINFFFNLFKSNKNSNINMTFFFNKFYYNFLFQQKINKYNNFHKKLLLFLHFKNYFIFNFLNNYMFFLKKKTNYKKFIFYNAISKPITIRKFLKRIIKKKYWIKKNKLNLNNNNNKNFYLFYKNYFLINKNNMINFILINKNNQIFLNYYLNYLINIWNIRSYNWKQIT